MANFFKLAENLLTNLDQSTQSALHKTTNSSSPSAAAKLAPSKKHNLSTTSSNQHQRTSSANEYNLRNMFEQDDAQKRLSESFHVPSGQSSFNYATPVSASANNLKSLSSGGQDSPSKSSSRTNFNKEDELIEFLNNPDTTSAAKTKSQLSINTKTESFNDDGKVEFTISDHSPSNSEDHSKAAAEEGAAADGHDAQQDNDDDQNKQLKREVKRLNDKIEGLMKRIKSTDEENNTSKAKIGQYQNQLMGCDRVIRELRSREEDLSESVRSKDSQLAVLRVRYEEADNELKKKLSELEALKSDSERILKDRTSSNDFQLQAVETLKAKISELEVGLRQEKEAYAQVQKDNMNLKSELQNAKQDFVNELCQIEKKLNDEKTKNDDLANQLKAAKKNNNVFKEELEEYKQKAAKILQAKDRLISNLKENATAGGDQGGGADFSASSSNLKQLELDEIRSEIEYLKDEINSKNASIDMLKAEINDLETQSSIEIETLKEQIRQLRDQESENKQNKEYLEQDLRSTRQQLEYAQEDFFKQKSGFTSKLQERELEIERLRSQITTKSLASTTEKELENRLHLLTENLIQKQTLIEALQSEKHSIFLQLERSEKRLQDYETIVASKSKSATIRMMDDDDTASSRLQYLRESPYDHEVTRKVKRAASEIDKFSIRLGVFLKKYPIARIFVIFYMFLLHLWVAIVLFTYKPEIHDDSAHGAKSYLPHN